MKMVITQTGSKQHAQEMQNLSQTFHNKRQMRCILIIQQQNLDGLFSDPELNQLFGSENNLQTPKQQVP